MVNRVTDSFTGTAGTGLTVHTGETGATWVFGTGFSGSPPIIDSTGGRVRAASGSGQVLFASGVATADGEYAEAVIDWVTVAGSVGLLTRAGNVGGVPRGYMAYLSGSQVTLMRLDNSSTFTTIVAAVAHVPSAGTHTYRITATGTGASVAVDILCDGVSITSGADTAAGRITAPASCGIYFDTTTSDTAGAHITSIAQEDPNAGAASTLTIVTPTDGAIAQRTAGVGTISVTGTYTGSPTSLEARLVLDGTTTALTGFDWSTKVASPSGAAFSFSFASVPENAWYNVQVRNSATPVTIVTSGKVGVGALVPLVGQSNAWLWFARGDSTLTPNAKLRVIGSGSDNGIASVNAAKNWAVPATASMNAVIAFGNRLATSLNTLIGVIDVSWDGSGLTVTGNGGVWIPTATAGQPYQRAKTFLNTITSKVEAVVVVNGETDGASGVSQATFYAGMGTLISTLRTDFGSSTTPIITPLLGKRTDGLITDANAETIRNAQVQKAADTAIYRVARTDLTRNADGVHLDPTGFTNLGTRCAQALCFALGAVAYYRGPQIASAVQVNATTFDVVLTHSGGSDFTPTSAISGFRALDGATPIAVSAAVHQLSNRVRLTLASAPTALPTIQYMWGTQPDVTAPLLDNSALALPLEFNDGVISGAATDTTVPTMNGSLTISAITSSGFTVSWIAASDNVAVTGYRVSTDGGTSYTDVGNVLTSARTGLAASTLYNVRVVAYDAAANTSTHLLTTATTSAASDTTAPVMVGSISISAITSSGFTASWSAATDAVGVVAYEFSTDNGTSYTNIGNVLTYSPTGLSASTLFNVKVRALDAVPNRATPLSTTATTSASSDVIAPVLGGVITISAITTGGFTAAWNAATDAVGVTGYEISVDAGTPAYTSVGNVLTTTKTALSTATLYNVRVRAYDAAGNRSTAITTTVTTATPTTFATSVTLTFQDRLGALRANLTGMKWAFFDQATPDALGIPSAKGTLATTNSAGVATLNLTGTQLAPGAIGWLVFSNSDGTATQSNLLSFAGPCVTA